MLSPWLRAGQARHGGCRACNGVVRAAGRRATTAARRRKSSRADMLTACYGTLVVSAIFADAVRKDRRRNELDQQLETARQELADLQCRQTTDDFEAPASDISIGQMVKLWDCLRKLHRNRPFMKEIHYPATASSSELVQRVKSELYECPGEDGLWTARQTDYERYEQILLAEETDDEIVAREANKEVHISHDSLAVEHLAYQLLRRARKCDRSKGPKPSYREAWELVRNSGMDYTYPSIDRQRSRQNTSVLNERLRIIIASPDLTLMEMIGRVCYNLLVSAYAPDMHTYNTLIVAFSKAGLHWFAEVFAWSFFHGRLLRPTPFTYTALLNHYKVCGNHGRFLNAISCIAGSNAQVGGKVARRHIDDCERDGELTGWAAVTELRSQVGEWVYEHVPLNRILVAEIIAGLLRYRLFHQAAALFFTCVRCGLALSTKVLQDILDECVAALDWSGSLEVIRGLMTCRQKWKAIVMTRDGETNWHLINRIYIMLDLCGLRGGRRQVPEDYLDMLDIKPWKLADLLADLQLRESALPRPCFPINAEGEPSVIRSKIRLLQIESLWKEFDHVRNTTRSIESKLLYPDFSLDFRTTMALHIGVAAVRWAWRLIVEVADFLGNAPGAFGSWLSQLASEIRLTAKQRTTVLESYRSKPGLYKGGAERDSDELELRRLQAPTDKATEQPCVAKDSATAVENPPEATGLSASLREMQLMIIRSESAGTELQLTASRTGTAEESGKSRIRPKADWARVREAIPEMREEREARDGREAKEAREASLNALESRLTALRRVPGGRVE